MCREFTADGAGEGSNRTRNLAACEGFNWGTEGANMLATLGLGVIGTVIAVIVVIAIIMFFVRRA